ncbi:MAG: Asp23/Gls24 family envelope stress response protein [Clostridia bacterium]
MVATIKKEKPKKILILGTSDDMVNKIANSLEIGNIDHTIYIEDVASKEEMAEARKSRIEEGKHVVPVPTLEIKNQFSGYFLDPLKKMGLLKQGDSGIEVLEKTIIRPTYSYLGNYLISDNVINSIVSYTVAKIDGISKVIKVSTLKYIDGMKLDVDIEVEYGVNIPSLSSKIKNTIIYAVDNATGINIFGININVKSIARFSKQNKEN